MVLSVAALPPRILSYLIRTIKKHTDLIESTPLLRQLFLRTFYANFCIGSTANEITENIARLRKLGIHGVILAFAREAQDTIEPHSELTAGEPQLQEWTALNLATIEKLKVGDSLAIRCTGAGTATINFMESFSAICKAQSEEEARRVLGDQLKIYQESMHRICVAAERRGVRVLIDAEGSRTQRAIDYVALELMSTFNAHGGANVLNTYQMYLKSNIDKIKSHLHHSIQNNYTLGLKMVRGAYLHTELERSLIHDTKRETDDTFDAAVGYLLDGPPAAREQERGWTAEVMLATHNAESVQKALSRYLASMPSSELHKFPAEKSDKKKSGVRSLTFAQLMGMADEVSLKLAAQIRHLAESKPSDTQSFPVIGVYKYTVWGSFRECLLYMLRRAEENRDAVTRSRTTAIAMLKELMQRLFELRKPRD